MLIYRSWYRCFIFFSFFLFWYQRFIWSVRLQRFLILTFWTLRLLTLWPLRPFTWVLYKPCPNVHHSCLIILPLLLALFNRRRKLFFRLLLDTIFFHPLVLEVFVCFFNDFIHVLLVGPLDNLFFSSKTSCLCGCRINLWMIYAVIWKGSMIIGQHWFWSSDVA
jgi:hypothetical protein